MAGEANKEDFESNQLEARSKIGELASEFTKVAHKIGEVSNLPTPCFL